MPLRFIAKVVLPFIGVLYPAIYFRKWNIKSQMCTWMWRHYLIVLTHCIFCCLISVNVFFRLEIWNKVINSVTFTRSHFHLLLIQASAKFLFPSSLKLEEFFFFLVSFSNFLFLIIVDLVEILEKKKKIEDSHFPPPTHNTRCYWLVVEFNELSITYIVF